jgi:5-oxoprolinase (ATP-hydrolysing) subunit A
VENECCSGFCPRGDVRSSVIEDESTSFLRVLMLTVDLNSDLGEGYGAYQCGDDDAMLSLVTSANVACGFHAGDPEIMARTFGLAKQRGVAVGAHPGFPDLWGFGRRRIPFAIGEIERIVAYQVGAALALASLAGHRITYVKAHGALGNLMEADRSIADAAARAIKAVDPSLIVLAIALSEQVKAAESAGLTTIAEIYADRGYTEQGRLVPRGQPGAMIEDPNEAAQRVLAMVQDGAIVTVAGTKLKTAIGSICVHGDSVHAVESARCVRRTLEAAGVSLAPFSPR